ncbi:MAG: hypothetical protein M3O61_12080 [Gemmatimonadota bacterium]|nr:hypothetical protein [Gemmatimonadota bacterium]
MTKARSKQLMKRAGLNELPLAQCRTVGEFNAELEKMSDAQLLDAWSRTISFAAAGLSDDELLTQLAGISQR